MVRREARGALLAAGASPTSDGDRGAVSHPAPEPPVRLGVRGATGVVDTAAGVLHRRGEGPAHRATPRTSSTNILLGDGYVAKVADFGLSRIDQPFSVVPVIELAPDRINNHLAEWVVESVSPGRAFRSQAIVLKKKTSTHRWPMCACCLLLNLSVSISLAQLH